MSLGKSSLWGVLSLLAAPAMLGQPGQTATPGCSAMLADHATINRVDAVAGADVFSGDLMQTSNDGRLMVQCGSLKLALAPSSSMRIFQSGTNTSVEVERGVVDYSAAGRSEDLTLYGLDVEIVPDTKQPAIGEIDVPSSCRLSVEATKGKATVTTDKETKTIEESQAYEVTPALGVDYSDDWHPVPADYPDFPRPARYHNSHHHVACALAPIENAGTKAALTNPDAFRAIAAVGVLGGIGYAIWDYESESPYKPTH